MPLRFVLDEQLRGKPIWGALRRRAALGSPLDVVRVGDPPDLPLGSSDPEILIWVEREGRILLTEDRRTIGRHLANHLRSGRSSPGVFLIYPQATNPFIIQWLELVVADNDPAQWRDQITHIT